MLKLVKAVLRERKKSASRSPQWASIRKAHLKANPICEACGSTALLQVHHITPFNENPDLELESTNLITLCAWNHCHVDIGHGDGYKYYNPIVREHAAALKSGVIRDAVMMAAKLARLPNDGVPDGPTE